jgi:hypothetical protein
MSLPSAPPLSNKKRKIGSGEIHVDDIPIVETSFSEILDTVDDIAKKHGKKIDIEEVDNLRNGIDQIINNVKRLKDLCKRPENKGFDVQVGVLSIAWLSID